MDRCHALQPQGVEIGAGPQCCPSVVHVPLVVCQGTAGGTWEFILENREVLLEEKKRKMKKEVYSKFCSANTCGLFLFKNKC